MDSTRSSTSSLSSFVVGGATAAGGEKLSEYHQSLHAALRTSQVLRPIHVEVSNESYWYYMRHRLGPKRHATLQVKQNTTSLKYEAFIYDLKRREEDLEIAPKKIVVAAAPTKWQAFKQGEIALKERDKNKPIMIDGADLDLNSKSKPKPTKEIPNTHFKVLIVSEVFHRVPPMERMAMVYRDLLYTIGTTVQPDGSTRTTCPPFKLKLASNYGPNVCALEIFRYIPTVDEKRGTQFIITALTPAQWRPEVYKPLLSERMGQSHSYVHSIQLEKSVQPTKQKVRIKKLTTMIEKDGTISLAEGPPRAKSPQSSTMADTLGLDPAVSGVKYKKLGGIYGHFFNDLSDNVRDMVLDRYKNNKELIRHTEKQSSSVEQKDNKLAYLDSKNVQNQEEDTFKPQTNLAKLRAKVHNKQQLGEADKGTNSQHEMRDEVMMSSRKIELTVIRMQRLRRIHICIRGMKRMWKREFACLTIQRVMRGRFGRRYAYMFSRLKPIAAMRLQKFYHDIKSYCILKEWRWLSFRLTRWVLPKIKRFVRNCFLSWISKRHLSAICIQRIGRGRIARVKIYKIKGYRIFFLNQFPQAVIRIQKVIRGYLTRKFYREVHVPYKMFLLIEIPAVIRLQRIFRGKIAKRITAYKRYELQCLLLLQRNIRMFVRRIWDAEKRAARRIKNAATAIQRHYRGYYDRKLYALKYFFYWYVHKFIPAIIKVQSIARGVRARHDVNIRKLQNRASLTIQRSYHFYQRYQAGKEMRRKLRQKRIHDKVACMQKHVRRYIQQKKFRRKLLTYKGKILLAAKVIMRAWRLYKINQKYQILLEDFRKQKQDVLLKKYFFLRKDIKVDLKELRYDVAVAEKSVNRYRDRYKELDVFLSEAEFRLTKIKGEMNKLDYEDFERGWAEALGQEYEFITHQVLLAKEEIRIIRHKMLILDREILFLYLELEESEMEFDEIDAYSNEMIERSRVIQLQRAERKANYYLNRMIYRERVHWKVDSNRANKMKNNRYNYQSMVQQIQSTRPTVFSTTVSYEKQKQRVDYEQLVVQERLAFESSERDKNSKPKA